MASQTYALTGATSFSFPFPVRVPSQIVVEVLPGGAVSLGNYEVKGAGPNSTQVTIVYPTAPTDGTKSLKITRFVQPERVTTLDAPSDITVDNLDAEYNNIYQSLVDAGAFAQVYYGPLAVDPTLDPQGGQLSEGDLYYNTIAHKLRVWTGTVWESVLSNSGVIGLKTKASIVVIGDSICGEPRTSPSWPQRLPHFLRDWGLDAEVHNISQNAATMFRFNTGAVDYTFDGVLAKDKAASYNPDLIIISLGFNDAVLKLDGRTFGQINADYAQLRNDLQAVTNCPIVFYPWSCWDEDKVPDVNPALPLGNNEVLPFLMNWTNAERTSLQLNTNTTTFTSGINVYEEVLNAFVIPNNFADSARFIPYWEIARLGHTLDGLHPTDAGNHFLAMAVANMLVEDWRAGKFVISLWSNAREETSQLGRYSFHELFNDATIFSSGVYTYDNAGLGVLYENYIRGLGFPSGRGMFDSWFRYYKGEVSVQPGNSNLGPIDNDAAVPVTFLFSGMRPDIILRKQVWKFPAPMPPDVESEIRTDRYGSAVITYNSQLTYTDGFWLHVYRYPAPDGIDDVYDEIQIEFA